MIILSALLINTIMYSTSCLTGYSDHIDRLSQNQWSVITVLQFLMTMMNE